MKIWNEPMSKTLFNSFVKEGNSRMVRLVLRALEALGFM